MYEKMADAQTEMIYANEGAASAINKYSAESLAAIAASKANFEERLDVLTNTIAANNRQVEKGFEVLTGVVRDHKAAAEKKSMLVEITNTVEDYADMIFSTVQGKHQKLADNYLSLKAYAAAAEPAIEAY